MGMSTPGSPSKAHLIDFAPHMASRMQIRSCCTHAQFGPATAGCLRRPCAVPAGRPGHALNHGRRGVGRGEAGRTLADPRPGRAGRAVPDLRPRGPILPTLLSPSAAWPGAWRCLLASSDLGNVWPGRPAAQRGSAKVSARPCLCC